MFGISVSNLHTQQAQAEGFTRPLFCCSQSWRSHKYLSGSWLKRKFTRFKRVSALHIKWTCIFFFLLVSFHHDNLKTAATQQITINACPFLICLVIIICAKKGPNVTTECSAVVLLFRRNNLSPLLSTKATLGARLLVPWWPASSSFFPFFCSNAALERHGFGKLDVFWLTKGMSCFAK